VGDERVALLAVEPTLVQRFEGDPDEGHAEEEKEAHAGRHVCIAHDDASSCLKRGWRRLIRGLRNSVTMRSGLRRSSAGGCRATSWPWCSSATRSAMVRASSRSWETTMVVTAKSSFNVAMISAMVALIRGSSSL